MRKLFFILLFASQNLHAQYIETFQNNYSIGCGFANSISVLNNYFSSTRTRGAFFIDFKKKTDSLTNWRINLISNLPIQNNNNTITEFNNFYISTGFEKKISFFNYSENLNLYYGADLYYKLDVNISRFVPFSTEQFGVGILAVLGAEYAVSERISLGTEFLVGAGVHQSEIVNNPGIIQWGFKAVSPKNAALCIRGHF